MAASAAFVARSRLPSKLAAWNNFPPGRSRSQRPRSRHGRRSRRLPRASLLDVIHFVNSGNGIVPLKADGDVLLRESQEFLVVLCVGTSCFALESHAHAPHPSLRRPAGPLRSRRHPRIMLPLPAQDRHHRQLLQPPHHLLRIRGPGRCTRPRTRRRRREAR